MAGKFDWLMGGLGGVGAGLGSMFSDWKNPYDAASGSIEGIPDMLKGYYNPYIEMGQRQIPGLEQSFGQLAQDPGGMLNRLGQGYQQSPGFDFAKQQAEQAAGHAQAAGGMAGTPQHQQISADMISGLASKDYNQWMQNALGMQGMGLAGQQGLLNTGFQGTNELAQSLGNTQLTKALMQMMSTNMQNQHNEGGLGALLGGGLQLAGSFFGL